MMGNIKQKKVSFTRESLYDLVWSEPFTSLSKRFKISDVGLRKICLRFDIPIPNRGYWRKVETNNLNGFVKPDLPNEETSYPDIHFHVRTKDIMDKEREEKELYERYKLKFLNDPNCKVKPELECPHFIISQILTLRRLSWYDVPEIDFSWAFLKYPTIHLNVPEELFDRSIRIMDIFLKSIPKAGYHLGVSNDNYRYYIYSRRKRFEFGIIEKHKIAYPGTNHLVPTGKLAFKLDHKEWVETRENHLENHLVEILAFLAHAGHQN